jgi:hypothetical protein
MRDSRKALVKMPPFSRRWRPSSRRCMASCPLRVEPGHDTLGDPHVGEKSHSVLRGMHFFMRQPGRIGQRLCDIFLFQIGILA